MRPPCDAICRHTKGLERESHLPFLNKSDDINPVVKGLINHCKFFGMSSQSGVEEEYLEPIPFMSDDNTHEGSRKFALVKALEDFMDEYDDLPLLVMALPFIVLMELWRDQPINKFNSTLNLVSINSYACHVMLALLNILPPLLFICASTLESFSRPSPHLQVYYGPFVIDILPQEVIDTIIDHLPPDFGCSRQLCSSRHDKFDRRKFVRAFSSYSLVCVAFVRRSQFHIFSTIVIRSTSFMDIYNTDFSENDEVRGARLRSIVQFIGEKLQLSRNISHLKISPSPQAYDHSGSDEKMQIQALLRELKGRGVEVRSLCLGFQNWALRPSDDLAGLFLPSSVLSNVTSLHIHDVFEFPLSFVSMFPSLRSLSLSDLQITDNRALMQLSARNNYTRPQPRSLVLRYASCELLRIMGMVRDGRNDYIASEAAFLDLSPLTHCDLVWAEDDDQSIASSVLIKTYGSTVTHLTYHFRCLPEFPDENFINLEHLPALRELTVMFEPMLGTRDIRPMRLTQSRPRERDCPLGPSLDFLLWFLSNLHAEAPLRALNITCPHMIFSGGDSDPAKLFLNLGWHRVDTEIRRVYDSIVVHNPLMNSKFMVNLTFRIPLAFPGGIYYEDDEEINRDERLQWMETMRRKWHRAMQTRLRKQFPLIAGCSGISLQIFYTFDSYDD
ncbi:hypothetical protein D9619_011976 [Psilocybe cf. subviscida]|uniref:F-box domain-containing protein n=1 Tax=Psilocybe cf. subviscida TaxID=2480587 RepID=A0A8H5B0P5_9AGAR|nr:hypothetical protein D9619_011976 [Psilocybe cf. subviscida]